MAAGGGAAGGGLEDAQPLAAIAISPPSPTNPTLRRLFNSRTVDRSLCVRRPKPERQPSRRIVFAGFILCPL